MTARQPPLAVIGAGWSGLACAVELVAAGREVTVYEAAGVLGGRARRVEHGLLPMDNGQHLLLGAYREALAMIHRVQPEADARDLYLRTPLSLAGPGDFRLRAPRWPAPLHTLAAVLTAHDCTWAERLALLGAFRDWQAAAWRCADDATVADLVSGHPERSVARLWAPLCLAALNTPPARASAQVFLNVLRDSFAGARADSDLVLPLVDLSRLFPEPAGAWIEARGSTLRRRTRVRRIARDGRGLRIGTDSGGGRPDRCAAVVIATAASQAAHLLEALGEAPATRALLDRIRFEPITTIYLEFPARVRFAEPIRQLGGGPGQWVFDRTANHPGSRLAIVISADGPHRRLAHDTLVDAALAQLREQFDDAALRSAPVHSRVITERRATHACTPERPQPAAGAIAERVFLAGDYTYAEYPATLEAAVRAGVRAARAVLTQD